MARIRSIKPEFFTSEQVVECSTNARLLFVGLWVFSDDCGRKRYSPKTLKMEVFPGDSFTTEQVAAMFQELVAAGLVSLYVVDGITFSVVNGWHHQRIDKPQKAKCPAPIPGTFLESSANDTRAGQESSRLIGEDRKGEDRNTPIVPLAGDEPKNARAKRRDDPVAYSDDFERFWEIYPPRRKQKKRTAWEAWLKAIRREAPLTIIEAVEEYADSLEGRGEYCKMPATWLNGDCWDDDRLAWDGKSRRSRVATAEELANWTPYGN